MSVIAKKAITFTLKSGQFQCPTCQSEQAYQYQRAQAYFSCFNLPLFPLYKLGEYVECLNCKDAFKTSVLQLNHQDKNFEAQYHEAIRQVMIHVLLADDVIEENELATLSSVYERISGKKLPNEELLKQLNSSKNNASLNEYLRQIKGSLNEEGKALVIKAAIYIAMADGMYQIEEQALINNIGGELNMDVAHLLSTVADAKKSYEQDSLNV